MFTADDPWPAHDPPFVPYATTPDPDLADNSDTVVSTWTGLFADGFESGTTAAW